MSKRVCVRSSVNIDEFFTVDHIVRPGETISSTSYSRRPGGKGANCAAAIAKAGGSVDFCGTINANDEWLRETLSVYGVHCGEDFLRTSAEPTGRAVIQLDSESGENCIVLLPGTNYSSYPLPDLARKPPYSHLLVQNEIPVTQTAEGLRSAKAAGLTTIFNPSPLPTREAMSQIPWNCVDWIVVNADEAVDLCAALGCTNSDPLTGLSCKLSTSSGIIMTRGAEGVIAVVQTPETGWKRIEAPPGRVLTRIVNTTGAGDTFTGYMAAMLSFYSDIDTRDLPLTGMLAVAGEAATACCEKEGAMEAIPTLSEVQSRFSQSGRNWPLGYKGVQL